MDNSFSNWMWAGIICIVGGALISFISGSMTFGALLVVVGCVLMFMGPSGGYHYPTVTYHDSNDVHYHAHQHTHVYPVQRVREGYEYSRRNPDGRTETVRYLKRSE